MPDADPELPSVVVGVDGSRWSVDAALWAADEAVSRDIPLRLVYAVESTGRTPSAAAHHLAIAEQAVRDAFIAVESTNKPVKIEVEIVQREPTRALLRSSRAAAMICVGSTGLHHATRGRVGSTAAALAAAAHCPVAIVHRRVDAKVSKPGMILAVLVGFTPDSTVLGRAVNEARLRGAPMGVLYVRPARTPDDRKWAQAELVSRVACWQRRYPHVDLVEPTAHDNLLKYLEQKAGSVQLVIVDRQQPGPADALLHAAGRTALDSLGCTVLICSPASRL